MAGLRIGEMYFETVADAMIQCDCGHTVLCNQAEEVWNDGKVMSICDECWAAPQERSAWRST